VGQIGKTLGRATRGVLTSPWLLLPLGILVALGLLEGLAQSALPVWAASAFDTLVGLAMPAYLALWVGMSQEAAQGRRPRGSDVGPLLARCAPAMYLVIFILAIGSEILGALGGLSGLVVFVPLVFNPWIDLACLTGVTFDRVGIEMRKGSYWLTAAVGILLLATVAWSMGMGLTSYTLPAIRGVFGDPTFWFRLVVGYIVVTWLWAVRGLILEEGGRWPSARTRRWYRSVGRDW
jgi:hypothetical protein